MAVMAAMLVVFATPALADPRWDDDDFDSCWSFWGFWVCDDDRDRFDFDDGFGFGDFEQEAESGDVDQSFEVSGTGDNSNQTAGIQGVANTGNAQNQIGVTDFGNVDDGSRNRWWNDWWWNDGDRFDNGDFEFDDVGSSIEVSPTNFTSSDQQVNQAAAAYGRGSYYYYW
jgi:hypothetical protein